MSYQRGSQGTNCATPPVNSATCYTLAPVTEEASELFSYTKNMAGFDASWAFNRTNKLLGGFDWESIKRHAEDVEAPKSDDYRYWIEYRNTGWENLTGRLKYEYLQRRSDLVNTAAATSVVAYYAAYDVNNFDANAVKLNIDWTPDPMWFVGVGATWRDVNYKDNLYGRTKDKNQNYDLTVSWGDANKLRFTAIGNWGTVENNQAYLAGNYPPPTPNSSTNYTWGSQNTQEGWMAAALVDWAATDKLMLTASYSYQKTTGGVDFNSGNTTGGGGFNGGPLVNYVTDNTKLQRFQIKGSYNINKSWSANAGYAYEKYDYGDGQMAGYGGYYPYFANFNTAAVGSGYAWYSGAFGNPSYKNNMVWLTVTYKFDPPPQVYVAQRVAEAPPRPVVAPPPPPAAAAGSGARPAGAEDHARLEGAVRLRQGGSQARREGGDRQPGRRQDRADPEARSRPGDGPHRPPRLRRLQPDAVASVAPMRYATTWSARACRRTRSRRSAWARSSRSCSAIRRT